MSDETYDIAVSFAGEQRDYVRQTVEACKRLSLNVFYDKDKNNEWWGQNFIRQQRTVYSSRTRFFVPFISTEYLSKPIPMDEFQAAMMTAVKQGEGYILPILMDDSPVPPDLLHPHIHYLRASDYTPEQMAEQLARRVGTAKDAGQEPTEVGPVVEHALELRMPKVVPTTWSKYEELDRVFEAVTTNFKRGAEQLKQQGIACSVRERPDQLVVRVERSGKTLGGLDIYRGSSFGDDQIAWSADYRTGNSSSINGWAKPEFDKEGNRPVIHVNDLSAMMTGNRNGAVSYDDFVRFLWNKLLEQIER